MRRTTTLLAATLLLAGAAVGCSDSDDDTAEAKPSTVTASATVTATPSLSQAETARLCSEAVAEAAPGWENWTVDIDGWQQDPETPEVCLGLADETNPPAGNRAYMDAFVAGLEMADDPRARQ